MRLLQRWSAMIVAATVAVSAAVPAHALTFNKGARCQKIAERNGFCKELVTAGPFTLLAYSRITVPGGPLVIYIEGDGTAWESRSCLALDPTPRDPLVVELAILDPSPNIVYLGRPGQYTLAGASECSDACWSTERFSETVIDAMNRAVSKLKDRYHAPAVSLIGYSGGGAVAVLIAARRGDIAGLRTIAGNLDHAAVSAYHAVSLLDGSLNPIDHAGTVSGIPQRHYSGSCDDVVPSFITRSFVEKTGDKELKRFTVVEGATHKDGWQERWTELLNAPLE